MPCLRVHLPREQWIPKFIFLLGRHCDLLVLGIKVNGDLAKGLEFGQLLDGCLSLAQLLCSLIQLLLFLGDLGFGCVECSSCGGRDCGVRLRRTGNSLGSWDLRRFGSWDLYRLGSGF